MTIISRIELDHPPLGQTGGTSLHDQIEAMYEKLGDAVNSRFYRVEDLVDGLSVDVDHNYQVAFDTIRWDLYAWDTGTGELTLITDTSNYQVLATPGNETTQLRVVNNTGGEVDIVVQLFNDPIELTELTNVDLETSPPEDGQALVYDGGNDQWISGASGDSSFKLQSISGEDLTIKSGFLILGSAVEVYAPNDIVVDFSIAERQDNGDYTVYINLSLLPDETDINGRPVRIVTDAEIGTVRTTKPYELDLVKQAPIGTVERNLGILENPQTLATRRHTNDTTTISALEFELPKQAIGEVGDVDNIKAGHVLTANSLPSASSGSYFNLANNGNDNSGNSRNLSDNGTPVYGQNGIKGIAGAVQLNGTDSYLDSTNTYFNPGGSAFTCGGWYYHSTQSTFNTLFAQWEHPTNDRSYMVRTESGTINLLYSNDGSTVTEIDTGITINNAEWFHCIFAYDGTTIKLYINGVLNFTQDAGVLHTAASPTFAVGSGDSGGSGFWNGFVDEFLFDQLYYSDDDIVKIFGHQLDHNRNVETSSQRWIANLRNGDHAVPVYDFLVDTDLDRSWIDLNGQSSTSEVSIKMFDDGALGSTTAVRSMERKVTASELDAQLPISHRFPTKPTTMELWVEVVADSGDFEQVDTSAYLLANDTQIISSSTALSTVLGSSTNVHLIASIGAQAVVVNEVTQTTGGGGEAGINYLQNSDAEQDATTGTVQVDVTTTEETTTPLIGTQSFRVLSQGIADGYHGWNTDAIDNAFLDSTKLKFTGIVDCDQEGWAIDIWNLTDSMQVVGTESDLPVGQSSFSVGAVPESGKTYLPRLVAKTAANGSIAVADRVFYGFQQTGGTDLNGWKKYYNNGSQTDFVISATPTGWILTEMVIQPFKDPITGNWSAYCNITAQADSAGTHTFDVEGMVSTVRQQTITPMGGNSAGSRGTVANNDPNTQFAIGREIADINILLNGIIELEGKPTWADYEPSGVALNNETLNANTNGAFEQENSQSIAIGTWTLVNWDTIRVDESNGQWNLSTDTWTCNRKGKISLTSQIQWVNAFQGSFTGIAVYVNGAQARVRTYPTAGTSTTGGISCSISLQDYPVDVGDEIDIRIIHQESLARSTNGLGSQNYLDIHFNPTFTSETTVVADLATAETAGFVEFKERTIYQNFPSNQNNPTSGTNIFSYTGLTVGKVYQFIGSIGLSPSTNGTFSVESNQQNESGFNNSWTYNSDSTHEDVLSILQKFIATSDTFTISLRANATNTTVLGVSSGLHRTFGYLTEKAEEFVSSF